MSNPITWRTIMGASPADAVRPMEVAQRSIGSALDQFSGLIKSVETGQQSVIDRQNEANVQAFLDRLQRAGTVDEVDALRNSGELDTLRAAIATKDLARVRGAEDARTTSLMQQATAKNTFDDQILARQRAPLINQAKMLVANRDRAGLEKFLAENDLGDESTFMANLDAAERQVLTNAHEDKKRQWETDRAGEDALLRPGRLKAQELNIAASEEQIKAARESRDLAKTQRERLEAAAKVAAEDAALKEKGNVLAKDGVFSADRSDELMKLMTDTKIGDDVGERQAVIQRLISLTQKGQTLPMGLVKQAILASQDEKVNLWNQGYANSMEENLTKALKATRPVVFADGKTGEANAVDADYQEWVSNRGRALLNLPPPSPRKR